jgi:hypothetical protein
MSNERPSRPKRSSRNHTGAKAGGAEETLKTEKIRIERKLFDFALKENPRGRFLRITEDVNGRRDTIIIPGPGLEEFRNVLDAMLKASAEAPPRSN